MKADRDGADPSYTNGSLGEKLYSLYITKITFMYI